MSALLLATMVEVDTLLWVAGLLLAVIGFLLILIGNFIYSKVRDNSTQMSELQNTCNSNITRLQEKLDQDRKERVDKHDELAKRIFTEMDKTKEKSSDLSETVAGMGAIYMTRNEFLASQKDKGE